MARTRITVKKVPGTQLRGKLKAVLRQDHNLKERESILATLEILADHRLSELLLILSVSLDQDVAAGRLLTTANVFDN